MRGRDGEGVMEATTELNRAELLRQLREDVMERA